MKGLAPHTHKIFEAVSSLECIKPYILVGGTALSLQIGTRQSEDLDFMKWKTSREDRSEVNWSQIEKELSTVGEIQARNLLDIDHVEFILEGVKLSFYSSPKFTPVKKSIHILNNLYVADITSIGAMKMEVLLRCSNFRDYYDIYSILKADVSIHDMITLALEYSGHRLKTKKLLSILTNGKRFERDSNITNLQPVYHVTPSEIELYIKNLLGRFS